MITQVDQLNLFKIISLNIKSDITCIAFGGTAMMFYGYKTETKDIDLLFDNIRGRNLFIDTIKSMGFIDYNPTKIYLSEKLKDKNCPLMFNRGEIRFDLFVNKIFQTRISQNMKENLFAVHEFKNLKTLKVKILKKEHLVQLKAITERDKDFEDILTIIKKDKNFDWQYLIDEAIWQAKNGDSWAILDTEKMIKDLQKYIFIEQKYLDQLYKAQS